MSIDARSFFFAEEQMRGDFSPTKNAIRPEPRDELPVTRWTFVAHTFAPKSEMSHATTWRRVGPFDVHSTLMIIAPSRVEEDTSTLHPYSRVPGYKVSLPCERKTVPRAD